MNYPHPSTRAAQGYIWLLRFLKGEGYRNIAKAEGRDPKTVKKYIREAAEKVVNKVEEDILHDLIPQALAVYKAALKYQLDQAAGGRPVDTKDAERLLKGVNIFDRPFEKGLEDAPEMGDLEAYLITKRKPQPVIEGTVEKVKTLDAAPSERRQPEDNSE